MSEAQPLFTLPEPIPPPTVADYTKAARQSTNPDYTGKNGFELFWSSEPIQGPNGEPYFWRSKLHETLVALAAPECNIALLSGRNGIGKTQGLGSLLEAASPASHLVAVEGAPIPRYRSQKPHALLVLDEMTRHAENPASTLAAMLETNPDCKQLGVIPRPGRKIREGLHNNFLKTVQNQLGAHAIHDMGDIQRTYVNADMAATLLQALRVPDETIGTVRSTPGLRAPRLFGAMFGGDSHGILGEENKAALLTPEALKQLLRISMLRDEPLVRELSKATIEQKDMKDTLIGQVVGRGTVKGLYTSSSLSWYDIESLYRLIEVEPYTGFTAEEVQRLGFNPLDN